VYVDVDGNFRSGSYNISRRIPFSKTAELKLSNNPVRTPLNLMYVNTCASWIGNRPSIRVEFEDYLILDQ